MFATMNVKALGMVLFAVRNCCLKRTPVRPGSWQKISSSLNTKCFSSYLNQHEPHSHQAIIDEIESKIAMLNGGEKINCNSHKQVSSVLFGSTQSVSKAVLQDLARSSSTNSKQRNIAKLVLQYRQLQNLRSPDTSDGGPTVGTAGNNNFDAGRIAKQSATTYHEELSEFDRQVEALFSSPRCKVNGFWKESLQRLSRPTAKSLIGQLDPDQCPMGYNPLATPFNPLQGTDASSTATTSTAGKKGSFLAYCREQKLSHPECILLTRCGDFYETFGIDAILLVEHCGLNSMGGKAKAGCPIRNVQATLDCLTRVGFRVAVFEEGVDTDSSPTQALAGSRSRIKSRFLAQIVSSAAPTYLYDLVLQGDQEDNLSRGPQARPYIGILSSKAGYTIAEVSIEERSVRITERLTPEAVACRLAATPPVEPLFFVPAPGENTVRLPFLTASSLKIKVVPSILVQKRGDGSDEIGRAKSIVVGEVLKLDETKLDRLNQQIDDFTVVTPDIRFSADNTITNPLHVETARQLGLLESKAIPSLVHCLLPVSAPAATHRFLRRYLLTPPPPPVAESLANLIRLLKGQDGPSLPPLSVPPLGKVLSMIRAGQASAEVFSEILKTLISTIRILDTLEMYASKSEQSSFATLVEFESGMATDTRSLRRRCENAIDIVEGIVCPIHHVSSSDIELDAKERVTDFGDLIPRAFFERNETPWRGRVARDAASSAYARVDAAANNLATVVARDFWLLSPKQIEAGDIGSAKTAPLMVQDIFNNLVALKAIPSLANRSDFIHPRDRNGKLLKTRYTTNDVQDAIGDYVSACENACTDVSQALIRLSMKLSTEGHLPAVVQAAHSNLIMSVAFHHAVKANSMGWTFGKVIEAKETNVAGVFKSVWPYWMDRSEAVANSFDLQGMWVLTAPNMSGKSTVMRSTAAAALLTICGLCAPLQPGSVVRRFDSIFVRGASSDVPAEGMSAFGAEMSDISSMLRTCGTKSLVFVDELSRGTSPRDGTRLAAAILESMAVSGMSGVFATHLHDIVALPLKTDRLVHKRMATSNQKVLERETRWTYRLEDGICTDSMALCTARQFGIPSQVIERAEQLSSYLPENSVCGDSAYMSPESVETVIKSITARKPRQVDPGWSVPASFDGRSCLYVLELQTSPRRFYVGESDDVRTRLSTHRAKGKHWKAATAFIVSAPHGKTEAREWETRTIRQLAALGYMLESTADGRKLRVDSRSD